MFIALVISFLWALGWLAFDAYQSDKGIRAGIAVEGDPMVTFITGSLTPSLWQIFIIGTGVIRVPLFCVGFIPGPTNYPYTFTVLATVALFAAGLKNIQGGRKWQWMFDHPGKTIPRANTFWKQFLGFWG